MNNELKTFVDCFINSDDYIYQYDRLEKLYFCDKRYIFFVYDFRNRKFIFPRFVICGGILKMISETESFMNFADSQVFLDFINRYKFNRRYELVFFQNENLWRFLQINKFCVIISIERMMHLYEKYLLLNLMS